MGQYRKAPAKLAPSKPARKHKRRQTAEGEARFVLTSLLTRAALSYDIRSPSPANSSTSGYRYCDTDCNFC